VTDLPDRLQKLSAQDEIAGLDFVRVGQATLEQDGWCVTLQVYFHPLKAPGSVSRLLKDLKKDKDLNKDKDPKKDEDKILIHSATYSDAAALLVQSAQWTEEILTVDVLVPRDRVGDEYVLSIEHKQMDHYFNSVPFSFRAACPRDVDCLQSVRPAAPEEWVDFPVDYEARDYASFRTALLDFASQRYPHWADRLEADIGIMLIEVLSALGDEFAYYQDRVGREAYLETATQRRSVRCHARLVDYRMHDGLAASTWLCVEAKEDGIIQAGTDVWGMSNGHRQIFEVGAGLEETLAGKEYEIFAARSEFAPHIWDEDDLTLPVGTRELYLEKPHAAALPAQTRMLLQAETDDPANTLRRFIVSLTSATDSEDKLLGKSITHLQWSPNQALPVSVCLKKLKIFGNIVPATAGRTYTHYFSIGPIPDNVPKKHGDREMDIHQAVEREGPNGSVLYLFSLPESENQELTWLNADLGNPDPRSARPEIVLTEMEIVAGAWQEKDGEDDGWLWRPSFFGSDPAHRSASQSSDRHYVLDDGVYGVVASYQREGRRVEHVDYRSGSGSTIRFGDGRLGMRPAAGAVFKVSYRLGIGQRTNVAQDTLVSIEEGGFSPLPRETRDDVGPVVSVRNPLPAVNGVEPESLDQVKRDAPYAYQADVRRAVTPPDYAAAVERLPWVQRAGAAFRWTGSWISAFVTCDPKKSVTLSDTDKGQLLAELDRVRQTGREVHVADPHYVDLDLEIGICVAADAQAGPVQQRVLERLWGTGRSTALGGFFSSDNFTFGTPLRIAALEAAIKGVEGVQAVCGVTIRRRGWPTVKSFQRLVYPVAMDEVIRVENDPRHPQRGSVTLKMEGGL
jgi:hypothetical protein